MTDAELRQRLERQAQRQIAIARTTAQAQVHDWADEERGMCRDLWIWAWVSALVMGAIVTGALMLAWWLVKGQ